MILQTYEEATRHFARFSNHKLYFNSFDGDTIEEITNVQLTASQGLLVKCNNNWIVATRGTIFNNLKEEQFKSNDKNRARITTRKGAIKQKRTERTTKQTQLIS